MDLIMYGMTTTGSLSVVVSAYGGELMIALYTLVEMRIMDRRMTGSALTGKGGMKMPDMAYIVSRTLEDKIAIAENTDQNTMIVTLDVLKTILALLKEQEPKNVIAEKRKILFDDSCDEARYYEDTFYHCPSCNRHLSRTHMDKNIHFCSSCGQAVKWE